VRERRAIYALAVVTHLRRLLVRMMAGLLAFFADFSDSACA
jgi:hypothetical protein